MFPLEPPDKTHLTKVHLAPGHVDVYVILSERIWVDLDVEDEMDLSQLGIALVSYLTGAVLVYAYINRNRYIDLLLASIAVFAFGTSMLLVAFRILPSIALILSRSATILATAAVFLLAIRIISWIYGALKKYLGRNNRA